MIVKRDAGETRLHGLNGPLLGMGLSGKLAHVGG